MSKILKLARSIRGYTIKELGEITKCNFTNISIYENGKAPKDKKIKKLANALKINEDLLSYSFGIFPEHLRNLVRKYPFYFMEKINEMCENCPDKDGMTEEQIDFFNKNEILKYIEPPTR